MATLNSKEGAMRDGWWVGPSCGRASLSVLVLCGGGGGAGVGRSVARVLHDEMMTVHVAGQASEMCALGPVSVDAVVLVAEGSARDAEWLRAQLLELGALGCGRALLVDAASKTTFRRDRLHELRRDFRVRSLHADLSEKGAVERLGERLRLAIRRLFGPPNSIPDLLQWSS